MQYLFLFLWRLSSKRKRVPSIGMAGKEKFEMLTPQGGGETSNRAVVILPAIFCLSNFEDVHVSKEIN